MPRKPRKKPTPAGLSPLKILEETFQLDYFYDDGGDPVAIPHRWHRGAEDQRLCVIAGENACGKSFFRRVVQAVHGHLKTELIHLSMEGRKSPMAAMVYGDEGCRSTGENSINTVLGAMSTANSRDKDTAIFWDEPDIGLSDSWCAGVGVRIREYAESAPKHVRGMYVVTHNRTLLRELASVDPHFVWLGEESQGVDRSIPLSEWVELPIKPRYDLEALRDLSRARYRALQAILKRV